MNCYDCTVTGQFTQAVGICADCGSGVCVEHAVVAPRYLTHLAVINRVERVEPPARVLRCETCAIAQDAAAEPGASARGGGRWHLFAHQ